MSGLTQSGSLGEPPRRDATYWRSMAEAYGPSGADSGEFPTGADLPPGPWTRREFLGLMAASVALAGLGGCSATGSTCIVPYAHQPAEVIPGRPMYYATTMTLDGYGTGLVVEAHEGRPTKIEGNPRHPASLGASGVFEQAAVLHLYDPDRAKTARRGKDPCLWDDFIGDVNARAGAEGEHLCLLLEPSASPTVLRQLAVLRSRWPRLRIFTHDPLGRGPRGNRGRALTALYGQSLDARHDFSRAQVILALDADPFASGPFQLRHARDFSAGRRNRASGQTMNRLYVVESSPTCTGSLADHRLRLRDADIGPLLLAVIAEVVSVHHIPLPDLRLFPLIASQPASPHAAWVAAVAADLVKHAGAGAILIGERQPTWLHGLAHGLNGMLGNLGSSVLTTVDPRFAGDGDLTALADALQADEVGALVILGGNPVYTAAGDRDLATVIARAGTACYLGHYEDETARCCEWFVPQAHLLECWGDAYAVDGTRSIQQPLIDPLYGGRSDIEVLALLAGDRRSGRELVRATWRGLRPQDDDAAFATFYTACLKDGIVSADSVQPPHVEPDWNALLHFTSEVIPGDEWEISIRADTKVHDGRFANNPWLQELPDPIGKLTWDNAAWISPASATRLGVVTGDLIALSGAACEIAVPVLVLPGQADGSISVALGYGRSGAERTANGVGSNAYRLRTRAESWNPRGIRVRPTGSQRPLAITQEHWSLEGRPIIRERTWSNYRDDPRPDAAPTSQPSLRAAQPAATGPQWGMVVDLSVCNGCSACVVACQAENNIPVVGRDNVLLGREMHWLRVDRYYRGSAENAVALNQPMACQHCEKAPCEYVCPTYATTHSKDGLNEMTYNRCVGTRFCSNNCPYKVRRFNWYNFNDHKERPIMLARNPQVTVRARGVMEKCTYCVQRIRSAGNAAAADGVPLETDQVVTACQQSCPTQAIVFGDITDPDSAVAALRKSVLAYAVLEDTGTQPRTLYLERLSNPNPDLA